MKLSGRDAARHFAKPDPKAAGTLLHGADPVRVALRRRQLVEAITGPKAAEEMRLERLSGADLRRDPAALLDAVKAVGFFPGPRALVIDEAGDGNAPALQAALAAWRPGDAAIVATAGALPARSALRKAFETARNAFAIAVYAEAMRRDEIEAALAREDLAPVEREAMADLEALAQSMDPADFGQFLAKLALYRRGATGPLSSGDVAACAPPPAEADLDALVEFAAEGRAERIAPGFAALGARSGAATSLTIAAGRHFRLLHAAAIHPQGPDAALAKSRPPVFGPRRSRMAAQCRAFGAERLEQVLGLIVETDLRLRSGRPVPGLALVERLFVRIARMAQPGG